MHAWLPLQPHCKRASCPALRPLTSPALFYSPAHTFTRHLPANAHPPAWPNPAAGVPLLGMSALTGQGAPRFMPTVLRQYQLWNRRVPTSRINRWLEQVGLRVALFLEVVLSQNTK